MTNVFAATHHQHLSVTTTVVIALLTLLAAACSQPQKTQSDAAKPTIEPRDPNAPYDGIDISSHQGNIDWDKVATDNFIRFVYIKATEGATYHSPHYERNVAGAHSHSILVGSYHYLRSSSTLRQQFLNFTQRAKKANQDLIPMIDVETRGSWSRQQLIDSLATFADMLQAHYGCRPIIYSTMTFYNHNLAPYFNKYPLYIGRYSDRQPELLWNGKYTVWQFSEQGIVPGIDAYVDLCHYHSGAWLDEIVLPKNTPAT